MAEPARGDGATLARYYDLDLADGEPDVDMYLALAGTSGRSVLELACGTGRIAVPLAAAGASVTGVDIDPHMLDRARSAWAAATPGAKATRRGARGIGTLTLVEADLTTLKLRDRFDLVIIAFNGLLLLSDREAQRRALEVVARHLAPDGRAIVDVWLPGPDDLSLYDGRLLLDWIRRDDEGAEWVSKSTSATYLAAAGTAEITTIFDSWRDGAPPRRNHRRDTVNFIGRSELLALHDVAGLAPQMIAGDHDMTPLDPDDDRVIVVSRLKPPSRRGPSVRRSTVRSAV